MKRNLLFLMIMLFTASVAFSQALNVELVDKKDKSATLKESTIVNNDNNRNIEDCYIEAQTLSYSAGTTVDLDFYLYYDSPDYEYLDGASINFPSGISVNSAHDCGGMAYNGETGDGVTVTWGDIAGGSQWGSTYSDQYWTVNVTIDPSFTGPILMDWFIMGDWYGGTPHDVSGQTDIQEPAACLAPTDLVQIGSTLNSIEFGWTENGGATTWEYAYGEPGFGPPEGGTSTGDNPVMINGLDHSTFYDFYVRADCSTKAVSKWVGPFTAATLCGSNTTFPWTEGFEGTFLPICWSKIVHSGNDIIQLFEYNTTPGGEYCALFSSYNNSSDYNQYLFSGAMTIEAANTVLSFNARKIYNYNELLEWGISTTTNPEDFTWTPVELEMDWNNYQAFIPNKFIGQEVYVGFHYYGNYLYYVLLDDVTIGATPPVPVSDWAIYLGIFLIATFVVVRYRKMRLA